ncbi:unnamed protein product [Sphagnum troendelagicum]
MCSNACMFAGFLLPGLVLATILLGSLGGHAAPLPIAGAISGQEIQDLHRVPSSVPPLATWHHTNHNRSSPAHAARARSPAPVQVPSVTAPAPTHHAHVPRSTVPAPTHRAHVPRATAPAPTHHAPVPQATAPVPVPHIPPASVSVPPAHPPPPTPTVFPPPPIPMVFPPPSNNSHECTSLCPAGYTNSVPGSPCGCVIPIQVELQLGINLETLFPLVSEFAKELAVGLFLLPSQVRIVGAKAADQNQEETDVSADFVPLVTKFDNTTADLLSSRFWNHQVMLNDTLFGSYSVISITYPGLPPSPPSQAPYYTRSNTPPPGDGGAADHPFGVVIKKKGHGGSYKIAIIVLASAMAAVICVGVLGFMVMRWRGSTAPIEPVLAASAPQRSACSVGGSMLSGSSITRSTSMSLGSSMKSYTGTVKTFSLAELNRATENFNPENVVGEGGFGKVYQGVLDNGVLVAVKVLNCNENNQQGGREFVAEVQMLSRLHHRNLVKLIGICTEDPERCLVYELIPNGSVESHLHGLSKSKPPYILNNPLDWEARVKIALGSARGLAYLHEDSTPRVIHRDFKASNILLEDDFTPKVSDFGLAKAAGEVGNSQPISTQVVGTFGYVAPEYAMTGHLLVKSDVYSYGVVLLELLTGRKPVDMSRPAGEEHLVTWARPLLTSDEGLHILVDSDLRNNFPLDSFRKVATIASRCVQPEASNRPFMGEVVQALKLVSVVSEASNSGPRDDLSAHNHRNGIPLDRRSRFFPDTSFVSIDSDSGRLNLRNVDRGWPLSASAVFTGSGRYLRELSDSFRRHSASGPLKTKGNKLSAWDRFRGAKAVTKSDHGATTHDKQRGDREHPKMWT